MRKTTRTLDEGYVTSEVSEGPYLSAEDNEQHRRMLEADPDIEIVLSPEDFQRAGTHLNTGFHSQTKKLSNWRKTIKECACPIRRKILSEKLRKLGYSLTEETKGKLNRETPT